MAHPDNPLLDIAERLLPREEARDLRLRRMTEDEAVAHLRRRIQAHLTEAERNARVYAGFGWVGEAAESTAEAMRQNLVEFSERFPPEAS